MISYVQPAGIAVITFSNPPVNALSMGEGLVAELRACLERAAADRDVVGVVVTGEGQLFSSGADKDFGADIALLNQLRDLLSNMVEGSPKPIVMAVNGAALGGGLELALAGHFRIASSAATFALPEVTLGLLPGGGGTQRLPRLVGAATAYSFMASGRSVPAEEALSMGFIDKIAEGDLIEEAKACALALVGSELRRTGELAVPDADQPLPTVDPKASDAAKAIHRCVEAARTLTFGQGVQLEKELFETLARSEASAGLRHVFLAKRRAGEVAGAQPNTSTESVRSVAVVGGGLMGTGIASAIINANLPVLLVEAREEARQRAAATIATALQRDVDKKRITSDVRDKRNDLLTITDDISKIADADVVIEAVFEDIETKRSVLGDMDRHASPGAILASNTSTLDLNRLATVTSRPSRVVGLHFFSPANVMQLVEVVRGQATDDTTIDTAVRFVKSIGKVPVIAGVCDGFIGNRMFEEYLRQAYFLLEEGALPSQVDAALERWGMAMGPFKVMDLAGQDIGWKIRQRRKVDQPDRPYSAIPDLICEMGRFGQKTGAGFYRYSARLAEPDPHIDQLVIDYSVQNNIPRRDISDQEIVERCVFALVNEGAKVLQDGIAQRPADIDVVYVFGYGFPPERGGPMFYAHNIGPAYVLERILHFEKQRNGWAWAPAPRLVKAVADLARRALAERAS